MEPKRRKLNSKELEVDENGFAVPESADHDKKILGYLEIVTTEANKSPDVQQATLAKVNEELETVVNEHQADPNSDFGNERVPNVSKQSADSREQSADSREQSADLPEQPASRIVAPMGHSFPPGPRAFFPRFMPGPYYPPAGNVGYPMQQHWAGPGGYGMHSQYPMAAPGMEMPPQVMGNVGYSGIRGLSGSPGSQQMGVAHSGERSSAGGGGNMFYSAYSPQRTGHPAVPLYMCCDDESLSGYQCLVRRQVELFEAGPEDIESNAQGRNKPIVLGQVGIRCRHCNHITPRHRARASVYYPAKLNGLYQAAQNMATIHLCQTCRHIPQQLRAELTTLRERKSSAGGGKKYWADGARVLGVVEHDEGLCFEKREHKHVIY